MKQKAFTLVELLIVIALIAILSVAVLSTINPIEQSNKARDAKVQNDAAEVLNALERYYAGKGAQASYPWLDVDVTARGVDSVNDAFYTISNRIGFGLCGNAVTAATEQAECDTSTQPGLLMTTEELKQSFLVKGYTKLSSDVGYKFSDVLYLVKQDGASGNSLYVCFIPAAKANHTSNSKLKQLTIVNNVPTTFQDATQDEIAAADYTSAANSLFKCVPE